MKQLNAARSHTGIKGRIERQQPFEEGSVGRQSAAQSQGSVLNNCCVILSSGAPRMRLHAGMRRV